MKRIFLIFIIMCATHVVYGATKNLNFFNENGLTSPNSTGTCMVGQAIGALPEAPRKPGYKFTGWKVYQTCGINKLDILIPGTTHYSHNYTEYYGSICTGIDRDYPCSDTPDIGKGEWKTNFSYGTIYGEANCNSIPYNNTYPQPSNSYDYTLYDGNKRPGSAFSKNGVYPDTWNGDEQYCWCRVTGFTAIGESNICTVSSPAWGYALKHTTAESCAGTCAYNCSEFTYNYIGFREALFNAVIFNGEKFYKTCGINNLDTSIFSSIYYSYNYEEDYYGDICSGYDRGYPCSDTPDIGKGEWKAKFSYGTIYGEASCISEGGTRGVSKKEWNEISKNTSTPSGNKQHCWCRVTGLKAANKNNLCITTSSAWWYRTSYTTANACAESCTYICAENVAEGSADLRDALFGALDN